MLGYINCTICYPKKKMHLKIVIKVTMLKFHAVAFKLRLACQYLKLKPNAPKRKYVLLWS